ncbi:MAG: 3-phosphoshikimate 1-carboxyvinyltransferase [Sporomusaceae bacterium]|jgi:3-phosphoshikimate 1-carboxyvinyltransferase|nr:3-phosphoshikimate 1-carboxyvinyltransferase [Sporomusaceae bacterium]
MISIPKAKGLTGVLNIPGDKSISHRSAILASLAAAPVTIHNYLKARDTLATIACLKALGAKINVAETGVVTVLGQGLRGFTEPQDILNADNSGTTMRLLAGVLAALPFFSILTGDKSLVSRPMQRIIEPLTKMGAAILARSGGRFAPLAISGGSLTGIEYHSPVASAQLKSAILLASLVGGCASKITEPYLSRNHTELMLQAFGAEIKQTGTTVSISPVTELKAPTSITVPGDISSAAFYLVAASIIPNSSLTLQNVGINPTRTGIIDVLSRMGASLRLINRRLSGLEEVADIEVTSANLKGVTIEGSIIPTLIDELPVIAVAALFAEGTTHVQDAGELRVKETDRISAITQELGKLGAVITETPDGFTIKGPQTLNWAQVDPRGDHRMAMSLAVAASAAAGADITDYNCVQISYPDFFAELERVRGTLGEENFL